MVKHVQDLYKYVQKSDTERKKEEWAGILDRISKQAFLRVVTCCQVASKLNSHYKVFHNKHKQLKLRRIKICYFHFSCIGVATENI